MLTWPGAFDLGPPAALTKDDLNCAAVPMTPGDDTDPRVVSQYEAGLLEEADRFESAVGDKPLPDGYGDVLSVASDFRARGV